MLGLRSAGLVLLVFLVFTHRAESAPPFEGSVFVEADIITSDDASAFSHLVYRGQKLRKMFDRRIDAFADINAYVFTARYDDSSEIEFQINPEFSSTSNAKKIAEFYAREIGRLPSILRQDIKSSWIHKGDEVFGGGNNNILIHTGTVAQDYIDRGVLQEVLLHEAAHTSLDAYHANKAAWLAAQASDGEFISIYARDNSKGEDVAESYLLYIALEHRRDRISNELAQTIKETIPARLKYFQALESNLYPLYVAMPRRTNGVDHVKLETPTQSRLMSGVVQLRGWIYDSNSQFSNVASIQIDELNDISLKVDQSREDVTKAMKLCKSKGSNIGWSSLFYTGHLRNGEHTVKLKNDAGRVIAAQTFESFTADSGLINKPFIRGVEYQTKINDFPYTGSSVSVVFDQAEQAFVITDQFNEAGESLSSDAKHFTSDSLAAPATQKINGVSRILIETPSASRTLSGVTSLRGWSLPVENLAAESLRVQIDDQVQMMTPVREVRSDVLNAMNILGDQELGWSLLYYSGALNNGAHRVRLFSESDGVLELLAQTEFTSFSVLDRNGKPSYLKDASLKGIERIFELAGFPFASSTVNVNFDTASQHFSIINQAVGQAVKVKLSLRQQ